MKKDDLKQLGAVGDALHNLWDAAAEQQKTVAQQQLTANLAIDGINTATSSINQAAKSLKGQLATEVQDALKDASTKAAELLTKKFTEANEQANLAAANYRSAVKWASWRVFGIAIGLGLAITAGGSYVLHEEIQMLRDERAQLLRTVNVLEQRGGRATVTSCADQSYSQRMCVHVVDDRTRQKYWMIIDGY